eukprot:4359181-Heterocapsa_arctica.AAC.1
MRTCDGAPAAHPSAHPSRTARPPLQGHLARQQGAAIPSSPLAPIRGLPQEPARAKWRTTGRQSLPLRPSCPLTCERRPPARDTAGRGMLLARNRSARNCAP